MSTWQEQDTKTWKTFMLLRKTRDKGVTNILSCQINVEIIFFAALSWFNEENNYGYGEVLDSLDIAHFFQITWNHLRSSFVVAKQKQRGPKIAKQSNILGQTQWSSGSKILNPFACHIVHVNFAISKIYAKLFETSPKPLFFFFFFLFSFVLINNARFLFGRLE